MWNEVWSDPRLVLTTLAGTDVCLCYVVALNKHCHTRVCIHMYLYTRAHTDPACPCVLVSSALGSCGLAGFSNTHALCLCCAQRPPVVWPHTIPAHLLHHITPKYLFSCRPSTASPSFNILIWLKNYVQPLFRLHTHRDDHAYGADLVIRPRCAVIFSPPLVFSPSKSLLFQSLSFSLHLPPNSPSFGVSFCTLLLGGW